MPTSLATALREARAVLAAAGDLEAGEAAVARKVTRDLDDAIARLEERDPPKDLVSIMCHDLRDPLASIVMGVGFLKKATPTAEGAAQRVLEAVVRSADRMSQVVGDFHDLAKLDAGLLTVEAVPCDVVAALRSGMHALQVLAQDKGTTLRLELSGERLVALCEPARLQQVVSKLVRNALKFTPPEGSVVLRAVGAESHIRISVEDTGRGIEPDRLPSIFDYAANARRTPRDGPGLGLAIVRGLVELQGGHVSVESRVGVGSTFALALPRA